VNRNIDNSFIGDLVNCAGYLFPDTIFGCRAGGIKGFCGAASAAVKATAVVCVVLRVTVLF
jgi:hypothetical protein